ncbi:DprA-like DNA processing chain A [Gordonia Phage JonJames]|nr:DprA-like DNA processing chain A [Gordonia Phage JonJames]
MLKLLITGSRDYDNAVFMHSTLGWALKWLAEQYPDADPLWNKNSVLLIEGECPHGGADTLARDAWWKERRPVLGVPANWKALGKRAGPERNTFMVDMRPDLTLGFPLEGSRGTWDCLRKSSDAGIPTFYVWDETGEVVPYRAS